ncbi:hypothetical protein LTR66_001008 [Elasticomyces elasticus]|nr:hypothetical protein LTR66_001008 [Elasticomyces elasticus]
MGSSTSKAARTAGGTAARKYPSRPSPSSQSPAQTSNAPTQRPPSGQQQAPGPTVRPQARASGTRDEALNLDASDPDFARSLRQLGAVQPNPTMSPTSTFPHPSNPNNPTRPSSQPVGPDPRMNPALKALEARARLQDEAEREFVEAGRRGHEGRQFLDVVTIRQVLMLRDEKRLAAEEIERRLGLRKGVVARLGSKGIFGLTSA